MTFTLDTPAGPVPARIEGEGPAGILLATGAGTGQDHPGVAGLRSRLAAAGAIVMTFEYAYRAAGRSSPDRPPRLLEVHRAAAARLREVVGDNLVLAGRSMGGRMATMLAADDEPCRAVVVYGYPLHPAGKPEQLRVEHLPAVDVPMLLITGTRDALALPALVERHLAPLPTVTLQLVADADHSFRRKGTRPEEMLDYLAEVTMAWLKRVEGLSGLADSAADPQ
ncbi:MAG TPA: alpha/beta family hydrolase [Acidimicrobiia bacterium]|nr:alpha/beta family hydrolase [Acidimicrobiia bacterium]